MPAKDIAISLSVTGILQLLGCQVGTLVCDKCREEYLDKFNQSDLIAGYTYFINAGAGNSVHSSGGKYKRAQGD